MDINSLFWEHLISLERLFPENGSKCILLQSVMWERSSILCLCWTTVPLKNRLLGNYVPLNKHCIQLAHTYLHLSRMHWVTQYAAVFIPAFFFFFPKSPFLQLSAFFSPKIAESRECGRIESQLADWIVFCSISGCIKRLRLWTYKKVMDASSLRLDRSELTSAEGRKGTKKECDLLT